MKKRLIIFLSLLVAAASLTIAFTHYYSGIQMAGLSPSEIPRMASPSRIADNPDGNLYVSDYRQRLIYILDSTDLNIINAFQVQGHPLAVAWGRGHIFVGNETTGQVEVYNPGGRLLYTLGAGVEAVKQPSDIAVDNDEGIVFVVDTSAGVVKVFDVQGPFLYTIPKEGITQEGLHNPTGIAVDKTRAEVIISDYGDPLARIPASIKVYDYSGIFRFSISGAEVGRDYRFSRPQGVAIGPDNNFFLTDSMLGKVLVFNRTSKQGIRSLGTFGTAEGQLLLPLDIVIRPDTNDVFVTNNRNGRIEAFRGGGISP